MDIINAATIDAKGIWVNMARRAIDWHQQLKLKFYEQGPLRVKKTGGLWGLACNAIHFIDLISWWTGESLFSVNTNRLDRTWLKSIRPGYFEVIGELLVKFSGGTELILQSQPNVTEDIMHIELPNKNIWTIDEVNYIAFKSKKDIFKGKHKLQSELTGPMVTKILTNAGHDINDVRYAASKLIDSGNDLWAGLNYKDLSVINFKEAGIIDPLKVVKAALQNAASVAGTILTTDAAVIEERRKDEQPAHVNGEWDPNGLI